METQEDILRELNRLTADQRRPAAPPPSVPHALVTAADVDAALAKTSTEELARIVESAGAVPMLDWRQLTAEQRRALRAANLLARRERAAQSAHGRQATQAEQRAVADRLRREEQPPQRMNRSWRGSVPSIRGGGKMPSLSRPDLAPPTSPEYLGWLAQYQAQQAAQQQRQQEQAAADRAAVLAKKRKELQYR